MITKNQALTERHFHSNNCQFVSNRNYTCFRYRANGACKTWKTRPDEFRLPVKRGCCSFGYITDSNANNFHVANDCPIPELREY